MKAIGSIAVALVAALTTVGAASALESATSDGETGTRVTVLTPGPADLAAMGANLMNPRRRSRVLDTALDTSAAALDTGSGQRAA